MKFKYNGVTEAVCMVLGKTIQPGEVVDVPKELEKRFLEDPQYDNPKPIKPGKGVK